MTSLITRTTVCAFPFLLFSSLLSPLFQSLQQSLSDPQSPSSAFFFYSYLLLFIRDINAGKPALFLARALGKQSRAFDRERVKSEIIQGRCIRARRELEGSGMKSFHAVVDLGA